MADANPIIMPVGQKGLTRRMLIAGLPLVGASLAAPMATGFDFAVPVDCEACHPVLALPFVRETTAAERVNGAPHRSFWDVTPSGSYSADCGTGGRYARLALDYMVTAQTPYMLLWAVFDIMRQGPGYSGIEVGFLSAFGEIATKAHAEHLAGHPACTAGVAA